MKKVLIAVLASSSMAFASMGCSYGYVTTVAPDKVVILRNDSFLFGALRKAFVCKVTDAGLSNCQSTESP